MNNKKSCCIREILPKFVFLKARNDTKFSLAKVQQVWCQL